MDWNAIFSINLSEEPHFEILAIRAIILPSSQLQIFTLHSRLHDIVQPIKSSESSEYSSSELWAQLLQL